MHKPISLPKRIKQLETDIDWAEYSARERGDDNFRAVNLRAERDRLVDLLRGQKKPDKMAA